MLTKDRLVFDVGDIDSSDQVGAHLIGTNGSKLSSTEVNGKNALDVFISGIDLSSEHLEGSAHVSGDAGQLILAVDESGNYAELQVDAGNLKVHDAVSKVELVAINAELDAQSITLSAINSKDFATEATLGGIKTQTDKMTYSNTNRLRVTDAPNTGFKSASATVGNAAGQIAATPLAGRTRIMLQNLGSKAIYVGMDNTVSSTNGLRVSAGAYFEMAFGESLPLYAISEGGSQDVRVIELA